MNLIYASKLYRASKRKDRISAALVNSANAGLVQQLSDDLDEEYQKMNLENAKAKEEEKQAASNESSASGQDSQTGDDGLPKSLSSGLSGGSFNPATDLVPYPDEGESADVSEGEVPDVSEGGDEGPAAADDAVEESTQIKACTVFDDNELTVLKGSLNLVSELSGVTRIVNKEKEIWIYYNDDTNLNNIMTDVIEAVARQYPSLEFNRLARSDNAIVFEVVTSSNNSAQSEEANE